MYIEQILIGIDQLVNTVFGGYADETISARLFRIKDKNKINFYLYKIVNYIFFWQKDHCYSAYTSEILRKQYPREYRNLNE